MAIAQPRHLEWQEEEEVPAMEPCKRLLTVDEYHRMGEVGIFARNERLELIRGEIYTMTPIGNRHAMCVMVLVDLLTRVSLKERAYINPQNPLQLADLLSEPQPDIVLLRRRSDYRSNPPVPRDVLLVIEVSDSSLIFDRKTKMPLYAQSGVPEAWLVDLKGSCIWTYRNPTTEGYQEVQEFRRGEEISPEAFPEERFAVDAILG